MSSAAKEYESAVFGGRKWFICTVDDDNGCDAMETTEEAIVEHVVRDHVRRSSTATDTHASTQTATDGSMDEEFVVTYRSIDTTGRRVVVKAESAAKSGNHESVTIASSADRSRKRGQQLVTKHGTTRELANLLAKADDNSCGDDDKPYRCDREGCGHAFATFPSLRTHSRNHRCGYNIENAAEMSADCCDANLYAYRKVERKCGKTWYKCAFGRCAYRAATNWVLRDHIHGQHVCPYRYNLVNKWGRGRGRPATARMSTTGRLDVEWKVSPFLFGGSDANPETETDSDVFEDAVEPKSAPVFTQLMSAKKRRITGQTDGSAVNRITAPAITVEPTADHRSSGPFGANGDNRRTFFKRPLSRPAVKRNADRISCQSGIDSETTTTDQPFKRFRPRHSPQAMATTSTATPIGLAVTSDVCADNCGPRKPYIRLVWDSIDVRNGGRSSPACHPYVPTRELKARSCRQSKTKCVVAGDGVVASDDVLERPSPAQMSPQMALNRNYWRKLNGLREIRSRFEANDMTGSVND